VQYRDFRSFVIADIPGIIEGASEGKGLGHYFLRHIERNATLLFLISADSADISKEYEILLSELGKYNPELLDKRRLLAISKCDLMDDELRTELEESLKEEIPGVPFVLISSISGLGITQLKDLLWQLLNEEE
jgi:GTP-binding protein